MSPTEFNRSTQTLKSVQPEQTSNSLTMKGRYLSDLLDTLSYGAGEGFSDQITGLVNLLTTDPRNTLSNLYQGAKSIVQNPQAAYQAAKQGVTEAMSSPQAAAKFIGQNFSPVELVNGLSNVGKMREMTVYHGTPHKFDAFDASKIGTGEGAQAYGHGIYVAESPKTAETYKRDLAGEFSVNGNTIWKNNKKVGTTGDSTLDDLLMANHGHIDPAIELAKKNGLDEWIPKLEALRGKVQQSNQGHLLTVDLPDSHIDRMLDWDKPLSEQHPDVQNAIRLGADKYKELKERAWALEDIPENDNLYKYLMDQMKLYGAFPDMVKRSGKYDGNAIYCALTSGDRSIEGGKSIAASGTLRQLGIPGIKYLDQSSRGTGSGTRNFVVFPGEEHNLKILGRK
jgi:hypothetical protein